MLPIFELLLKHNFTSKNKVINTKTTVKSKFGLVTIVIAHLA